MMDSLLVTTKIAGSNGDVILWEVAGPQVTGRYQVHPAVEWPWARCIIHERRGVHVWDNMYVWNMYAWYGVWHTCNY